MKTNNSYVGVNSLRDKNIFVNTSFTLFVTSILFLLAFLNSNQVQAQEVDDATKIEIEDDYKPFKIGAHLKNMHLWHGFVVQSGAIFATNMDYTTRDGKFTFGFWGGASFTGSDVWNENTQNFVDANYKEFSLYAVYRFSDRFFTELVTHNNITGVEERGDKLHYWDYNKKTSYNFPDLNFGYNFDKFSLYYGVILFGQAQDVEKDDSGNLVYDSKGDLKNSWTQYAEIKGTLFERAGVKLTGFVGGAWSMHTDNTFYTKGKGNIINVGLAVSKDVFLGSYKLPVEVTAMTNPEKEITVLQLDLTLF